MADSFAKFDKARQPDSLPIIWSLFPTCPSVLFGARGIGRPSPAYSQRWTHASCWLAQRTARRFKAPASRGSALDQRTTSRRLRPHAGRAWAFRFSVCPAGASRLPQSTRTNAVADPVDIPENQRRLDKKNLCRMGCPATKAVKAFPPGALRPRTGPSPLHRGAGLSHSYPNSTGSQVGCQNLSVCATQRVPLVGHQATKEGVAPQGRPLSACRAYLFMQNSHRLGMTTTGASDGRRLSHRMDRPHIQSVDRVHQSQPGV